MITFNQMMVLMLIVVCLALAGVFLGGWLVFRAKAQPGEGLIRTPKGQVFTIPSADDAAMFPDEPAPEEKAVLERAKEFTDRLFGGNKS
jgi:hypothetical protein